jgi:hypothetical protein
LEDIPHEHVDSAPHTLSAGPDHHASGSGSVPRPASLEPRRRTVA